MADRHCKGDRKGTPIDNISTPIEDSVGSPASGGNYQFIVEQASPGDPPRATIMAHPYSTQTLLPGLVILDTQNLLFRGLKFGVGEDPGLM